LIAASRLLAVAEGPTSRQSRNLEIFGEFFVERGARPIRSSTASHCPAHQRCPTQIKDYSAVTMGHAAELLGVQPAFLRSLVAAGVLTPLRSGVGHRRYSRRQLELATRIRELFDLAMTLDAAARIVEVQDRLDTARARMAQLEDRARPG